MTLSNPSTLASGSLQPADASLPIIELRGLGIYYRLHRRRISWKQTILQWDWGGLPPVHWALRGVDLECREGDTVGIVGPNGAGKSTLCLVLSQILTPDEGEVTIRGKVSALVSLVSCFQKDLTGRDNLFLYASFLGIPRQLIEERMEEIVGFAELGDFIDQPIRFYSSGMRARLGFSVATTLDPEILILDEVLSVGDRAFRAKSRRRIQELMTQSKLIVIVSHSSPFLRSVCSRCLWLERGRVRQYGPPEEVLDAYDEATGGKDPIGAGDA